MIMKELRLAGVIRESIVDGPGMRMTIFTQGCPHNCEGCHNPQTHSFDGGYISHPENILKAIDADPILKGVTFSGGEPFMQAEALAMLAEEIHKRGLNVLSYTGFTYEELLQSFEKHPDREKLLRQCDYLIDGRFVLALRSLDLKFRGSSNQRIIDVKKSLESGKVVETNFD
ncbi:MAG: anaerobic ribonucleoside-triphosphate reductase activating protein [Clostridia bacterium]|nr:anaerobic ribonucleoside-triphosphate reductase activating protein [Clostridia bacterium]